MRVPYPEMGKAGGQQAEGWREIRSLVLDVWGCDVFQTPKLGVWTLGEGSGLDIYIHSEYG